MNSFELNAEIYLFGIHSIYAQYSLEIIRETDVEKDL